MIHRLNKLTLDGLLLCSLDYSIVGNMFELERFLNSYRGRSLLQGRKGSQRRYVRRRY